MTNPDPYQTDSRQLAKLMDLGHAGQRLWRTEELGAILRHQLSAPVQFDLAGIDQALAGKLRNLTEAEGLLLQSFSDLLHHPAPPVELLILLKDFAKACRNHPDSPLPQEIATLLYLASIAVAMMRACQRITALDDEALRDGVQWLVDQTWVDDRTGSLFREFSSFLDARKGDQR